MFEVGATVDSTDIGDLNEFGVKSTVQRGCTINTDCKLNPLVTLPERTKLPSHSVVIRDGFIRTNTEPLQDTKKNHMKEMSTTLAGLLVKHSTQRKLDANGVLGPEEPKQAPAAKPGQPQPSSAQQRPTLTPEQ